MPLFSDQDLTCCVCAKAFKTTCASGNKFDQGVCSVRCYYEKDWRRTCSMLGNPYRPDPRDYDQHGFPVYATVT